MARIAAAGRGLHGVVNDAGVAVFLPMNETPEADIDFVFDVNVYGPYRINNADQPYRYRAEELAAMLKEAMAGP